MRSTLFAAVAALALVSANAWAESNYLAAVETPATGATLQANTVLRDTGSEATPEFVGVAARTEARFALNDTGSEGSPRFNSAPVSYGFASFGVARR